MGIDFSHGKAHWSYSGFNSFRHNIAKAVGINLDEMQGYGSYLESETNKVELKSWDILNDDIKYLLDHSDCDGDMPPEICLKVSKRLREILAVWVLDKDHYTYDVENGLKLANGMEEAAEKNINFMFR